MADYIVHKPAELSTVHKKRQAELLAGEIKNYLAMPKYDGCCVVTRMYPDGTVTCSSRTDKEYVSTLPAARLLAKQLAGPIQTYGGLVVISEAWHPDRTHGEISGEFRREAESPWLRLYAFDCLTMAEFEAGFSEVPYHLRRARMDALRSPCDGVDMVQLASGLGWGYDLKSAQTLCNHHTTLNPGSGGVHDGLILTDPNGRWERGTGKTGEWLKIKRLLTFDLRVTEVNTAIGGKTGRTVYKLVVDFGGRPLGVGSGVPHKAEDVPKVGDIVEVHAMDYSADGLVREPRFKSIRFDKTEPDTISIKE